MECINILMFFPIWFYSMSDRVLQYFTITEVYNSIFKSIDKLQLILTQRGDHIWSLCINMSNIYTDGVYTPSYDPISPDGRLQALILTPRYPGGPCLMSDLLTQRWKVWPYLTYVSLWVTSIQMVLWCWHPGSLGYDPHIPCRITLGSNSHSPILYLGGLVSTWCDRIWPLDPRVWP